MWGKGYGNWEWKLRVLHIMHYTRLKFDFCHSISSPSFWFRRMSDCVLLIVEDLWGTYSMQLHQNIYVWLSVFRVFNVGLEWLTTPTPMLEVHSYKLRNSQKTNSYLLLMLSYVNVLARACFAYLQSKSNAQQEYTG